MLGNSLVILARSYSSSTASSASSAFAWLGAAFIIILVLYILFCLALVALEIAMMCAGCEVLRKAKEPRCWKALIPFYGTYVLWKLVWDVKFFWISIGIVAGMLVFSIIGIFALPMFALAGACLVASIVFAIISNYRVAKAFGHGGGWTCGLVFLYPVFLLMLAFGKSEYQGNVYQKSLKK